MLAGARALKIAASVPPSEWPMRNGLVPAVLARDHRDAFGYGFGVLIQAVILRATCLRRPFEQIDVQTFS